MTSPPENAVPSVPERIRALWKKQRELMALPPERALAEIFDERQPLPLVHSFPEEDFYLLVHEIGPEDALELLGLASDRQWEFILDAEAWDRDRIDAEALTRWMNRLMQADPDRFVGWVSREKSDLLELYLYRNVDIALREEDQAPTDFPEDYFSDDETFYLRLRPAPLSAEPDDGPDPEAETEAEHREIRDDFLRDFLKRLSADDHVRYQNILLESAGVLPAEMEEALYRLRNVRRAERGFAPFEEAVGLYQPLSAEALATRSAKTLRPGDGPAAATPATLLPADDPLARTLAVPDLSDVVESLQSEFAGLCNHLIVADRLQVRDRETLKAVARKASGYVAIGIERTTGSRHPARAAGMVRRHGLMDLFRVGYGQAAALRRRAARWRSESWAERRGLPPTFWGEEWFGVLGGLWLSRPMFHDKRRAGERYRDFRSMDDIRETDAALDRIVAADRLLDLAELPIPADPERWIFWGTALLTFWARRRLGLSREWAPVPVSTFRPFFDGLWENPESPRLSETAREDLIHWLAGETGLTVEELAERVPSVPEDLIAFLEAELGRVEGADLDPRFVVPFLLS